MKTLLTLLSFSILGFFSLKSKNQSPEKGHITKEEVIAKPLTSSKTYTPNVRIDFQKNIDQVKNFERAAELIRTISHSRYTPDNNPVTYDENPANYPLYRPKTYSNINHDEVQSPTHYNAPPPGACAVCRDGSFSFSRNHRGTCSHHGGVSKWLK